MFSNLARLAALMASFILLHIAHGGTSALVAQQGGKYGFSDSFLGVLISVVYVGFFVGNYVVRYLLPRISYIRTFAACAATLGVWVLLMPFLPNEAGWLGLRFLYGVFFSTIIVICDGWMNSASTNENRSSIYSANMTLAFVGLGISQYILILGEELGAAAFSIAAMFMVLSLVPVCLTRFPEPQIAAPKQDGAPQLSLLNAYHIAPVSFLGQFIAGLTQGASWLFVLYAEDVAETPQGAASLAALFFVSGFTLQVLVGWLSDRAKDRRTVMGYVYLLSVVFCVPLFFGKALPHSILALLIFIYGAVSVTAYSLNVAYGQDFVESGRSAEYAGRLFQSYSVGALLGPLVAGYLMEIFSLSWLFGFCGLMFAVAYGVVVTGRVMPRYIPAKTADFQPLSPYIPPAENAPEYTELEVGPAPPDDLEESAAAVEEEIVGPAAPDDLEELAAAVEEELVGPAAPEDLDGAAAEDEIVGPVLPEGELNNDGKGNDKKN